MASPVVIDDGDGRIETLEGATDGLTVPIALSRVGVVEGPSGDAHLDHQLGRRRQQPVASSHAVDAGRTAVGQHHRREVADAATVSSSARRRRADSFAVWTRR